MAWCHQATSHYLSQGWPSSLLSYGITRPQCYNIFFHWLRPWTSTDGKWGSNRRMDGKINRLIDMMTSSKGNIFCVTGHLCGEFTSEFPTQRLVTRSFDVFFDLHLNKWLSKQWWGWWFETPSPPLRRHCNGTSKVPTATVDYESHLPGIHYKLFSLTQNNNIQWKYFFETPNFSIDTFEANNFPENSIYEHYPWKCAKLLHRVLAIIYCYGPVMRQPSQLAVTQEIAGNT